jgi:predicted RNA-binding protein (virulence factor B family)
MKMPIFLATLGLALSIFHTSQYQIKKFDGNYYYAPAIKGKTQLVFKADDVKNGKVKIGDKITAIFLNNEEEDLINVIRNP